MPSLGHVEMILLICCSCDWQIINKITSTLASNPSACFLLQGYSQGAAATVNAMPKLKGDKFKAVKGVFLIGDPCMRAGLPTNVDPNGGTSTRNSNGLERTQCGIPKNWYKKTLDVCMQGDGLTGFRYHPRSPGVRLRLCNSDSGHQVRQHRPQGQDLQPPVASDSRSV